MLILSGPVSNAERQRKFRERNPGYYRRYSRRRNAAFVVQGLAAIQVTEVATPMPAPAPAIEVMEAPTAL